MSNETGPKRGRATVREVASRAGVSRMTVSNVLMGRDVVSSATRERVLEAARELDYVPVRPTLQNRHTETRVLALSLGPPEEIRWNINAQTYEGMCKAALRHGYDLMTLLRSGPKWAAGRDELLYLDRRSDGVLFANPIHEERSETLSALVQHDIPTVACYRRDVPEGVAWIDPDNDEIVRGTLEHLVALGHTNIAHLSDRQGLFDARERARLFRKEAATLHVRGHVIEAGYGVTNARFTQQAFEAVRASGATAVFALNDLLALELWDEAERCGARVPEELSIVGVDNTPEAHNRGLTTWAFDYAEVGREAVESLVALLQGRPWKEACKVLPVALHARDSTCAPRVSR